MPLIPASLIGEKFLKIERHGKWENVSHDLHKVMSHDEAHTPGKEMPRREALLGSILYA